jgi:hypothetical protein
MRIVFLETIPGLTFVVRLQGSGTHGIGRGLKISGQLNPPTAKLGQNAGKCALSSAS